MENSEDMFFFISDISGYTAFMLQHEMDYEHGMLIIMQLMESLVKEVKIPLEISKLEGDALFIFVRKSQLPKEYQENPLVLGQKIMNLFDVFYRKREDICDSKSCKCGGCDNTKHLELKIVGHYGKAALAKIGSFLELSGVDVIIPHRLLKNQIKEKCYLVLTEPAYKQMLIPADGKALKMEEHDKDIGSIPIYVYYPKKKEVPSEERKTSTFEKRKAHLTMILKNALLKMGLKRRVFFRNLPAHIEK